MKKLNQDFFKISFIPDETEFTQKGNVVTATLTGEILMPHWGDFNSYNYQPLDLDSVFVKETGVAVLAEGDEFNYEVGKKIALAKAENKCYEKTLRYLSKRCEELREFVRIVDEFSEKVVRVSEHNEDYIKRIGG